MNRERPGTWLVSLSLSLVCALSVWTAMLAWRPLTESPSDFTTPLLLGVIALALTGSGLRWAGVPALVTPLAQLVVAGWALVWATTGSPLPSGDSVVATVEAVRTAVDGATRFSVPVPAEPTPVAPLFLAAGLGALVVADTVALTWRRVPLAGVPLLVVLLVPTNLAERLDWWLFVAVSVSFLTLLRLDRVRAVRDWGRDVEGVADVPRRSGTAGATLGLGVAALASAVLAGTVIPVADLGLGDRRGTGGGGGSEVTITNPLIDMRRNLSRGADVPLLTVRSEGRRPSYLATTVLAEFTGKEWTSGDRNATSDQRADGRETPPVGVSGSVPRAEHPMEFMARPAFHSRWLVLPQHSTLTTADGDWRRDSETQDYVAWSNELTTAGLRWSATEVEVDLDPVALDRTRTSGSAVATRYSDLPESLPAEVHRIAEEVTAEAETPFRKARALQSWFRSEFTYSLEQVRSVGNDELLAFLAEDGREGYCEQFAGAMAVMARSLGIPSRVVVGLLSPEPVGPDAWEFSAHDLHAWPELYFPGSGWVRFEPTPAARTSSPPSYSVQELPAVDGTDTPRATPTPEGEEPEQEVAPEEDAEEDAATATQESFGWAPVLWGAGGFLLIVGLGLAASLPRSVRRRRRARRMSSGTAEDLWAELRDEAVDLGLTWPEGRSPREVGRALEAQLDGSEPAPEALHRIVAAVEQDRYARPGTVPGTRTVATAEHLLAVDLTQCQEAMRNRADNRTRRRARWWPRSVFASGREPGTRDR